MPFSPSFEVNNYLSYGYASDGTRVEQPSFDALQAPDANMAIEGVGVSSSTGSGLTTGIGNSSRAVADGTGNQTLTHGLGVTPKLIHIQFSQIKTSATSIRCHGTAVAVSPNVNKKMFSWKEETTVGTYTIEMSNANQIISCNNLSGTATATADLTSWDTNTFTINWSVISDATVNFFWEAVA